MHKMSHENMLKFIKADPAKGLLRINFDYLCKYLFQYESCNFSVSEFEKILNKELEKLQGYVINDVMLTKICNYIEALALYLTRERSLNKYKNDITLMTKRFQDNHPEDYKRVQQRMLADLQKIKNVNPEKYQKMLVRYKRRFGANA
jgi:hypothetical protein